MDAGAGGATPAPGRNSGGRTPAHANSARRAEKVSGVRCARARAEAAAMRTDVVTVIGEGWLGTEVRTTEVKAGERKGERMANARVACHVPVTGAGGGQGTVTVWLRLLAFGQFADALAGKSKGDEVAFRSPLAWNRFQRRDGTDASSWECAAEVSAKSRSTLPRPCCDGELTPPAGSGARAPTAPSGGSRRGGPRRGTRGRHPFASPRSPACRRGARAPRRRPGRRRPPDGGAGW